MSAFELSYSLPSIKVTKDLIEAIENFLVKRMNSESFMSEDDAKKSISVEIIDSFGTERFSSIREFPALQFSDTTKKVVCRFDSSFVTKNRLRLRINFTEGRLFSTLNIDAESENARELALGLKEELIRIISPHKTWYWVLYPLAEVWGVLVTLFFILLFVTIKGSQNSFINEYAVYLFVPIAIYFNLFVIKPPYCAFDSRKEEYRSKLWKWAINGMASFIVFGTIMYLVRRWIIGV